jgi:hypothetical protein
MYAEHRAARARKRTTGDVRIRTPDGAAWEPFEVKVITSPFL